MASTGRTVEERRQGARAVLIRYLRERHMRRTPERFAVLDEVVALKGFFSSDQIGSLLADQQFHVSRQTIYSTLELLVQCGLLRRHRFTDGAASYELVGEAAAPRYHLVCLRCGKVKELKASDSLPPLASRRFAGFTPEYYELMIYGVCSTCTRRAKKAASSVADKS